MKSAYTLTCIAPDGDCQTERGFDRNGFASTGEAWNHSNDMGSRWFFYPIHVITTPKGVIRDVPHGMSQEWKGRKLSTLCKALAADSQHVCNWINGECPCDIFPA